MKESLFLTKNVVAKAVRRIFIWVDKNLASLPEYKTTGFAVCVVNDEEEPLFLDIFKLVSDIHRKPIEKFAEKKARTSFREKKDLKDLFKTPAKIQKGDPRFPGGIFSAQCKIAIGVSGFKKAEADDGIAKHILVEIKTMMDVASKRQKKDCFE